MHESFTIRPEWYYCADRAREEWDSVWTKCWHMGPREEELPEEGDLFVHTFGHESLLFVRRADGEVDGLFNVCRHRGNRLVLGGDGPTTLAQFRCAFHGWCYDLEGSLASVPYRERFAEEDLAPANTALRRFRVESFAGWLWFTLSEEAPPLAEYLGRMTGHLAPYRMERARIVDYKTFEFRTNWKTVLDAFHESYHFQELHRDVLSWGNEDAPITLDGIHSHMVNEYGAPSRLYPDRETVNPALAALLEASGIDPATFPGKATDVRGAVRDAKRDAGNTVFPYESLSDSQLTDAWHFLVFPSVHFNLFPEFYVAMRYRPHPSGDPERVYYDFIMCAPLQPGEEVPAYRHRIVQGKAQPVGEVLEWGVRTHPVAEQILGEDVDLVEEVQSGQKSAGFDRPILSSDERRIAHFHRNLDRLIAGESLAGLIADNPLEPEAHRDASSREKA